MKHHSEQKIVNREQQQMHCSTHCLPFTIRGTPGFTLIETLVAISFLTLAILAPMSLASQSLASAYYARDQVTAFHLAQEALEAVRSARDANVLENAFGTGTDLLEGIPTDALFVVDTRDNSMTLCSGNCPPLQTDGDFYAYGPVGSIDVYDSHAGWVTTRFTREVRATYVSAPDEIKVSATVKWKTGRFQERSFTISENLYRWIDDGAAVEEAYSQSGYYSQASYGGGAGASCTTNADCAEPLTCTTVAQGVTWVSTCQ